MYELVNTSVPNGLIAGTHGFATVSMTKGMPDAIRTRVESFCAYPHRTSAHDQSYFRDNPVNWFHLQIPSGDHVVGRTAPADFDYTGRTNRLAHTLVFGAKEMPIVGGAYVLGAESRRFLAEWSGDPKYLAVDKLTAGRLGLADIPKNTTPTNWTATFGEDGAKYARRFAALVAKNVSGGNKCVYFKTSTAWDGDGTRLLGLFADLINLLPEGIRPFVTFSTFAACVPNGVACHLRGVYDKDRAFEIASTTQPWVDCEHGRIVHEELLPEESEIAAAVAVAGREVIEGSTGRIPIGAPHGGNSVGNSGRGMAHGVPNSTSVSEKGFFVKLMIALVLLVLVIVGGGYWFMQRQQKAQRDGDELWKKMQEQQARELAEERADAERNRQDAEKEALRNKQRQEEERKAQIQAEEQRRKEEEERNARKEKEADEARRQKESEQFLAKVQERQRAEAAAEQKVMAEERAKWPRKIDAENVLFDKTLDDVVLEDGRLKFGNDFAEMQLTNAESIVVHWQEKDGSLHYVATAYEERYQRDPQTRIPKKVAYKLKNDVGLDSPWVLYRLILGPWDKKLKQFSKEKVFWLWRREKETVAIFQEKGALDVQKTFFGGDEKLYSLWSKIKVPKCFRYEFTLTPGVSDDLALWLKNRYYIGDCWTAVNEGVAKLVLKEKNEELLRLQRNIDNADKEKGKCANLCKEAQDAVARAEAKNEEMKKMKKDEKGLGNNTKRGKWDEIKNILRPYFKSGMEFKMANFDSYIQVVKSQTECQHKYKHNKERFEKEKEKKEAELKQWEEVLKNMVFSVSVGDGVRDNETGIKMKQNAKSCKDDDGGSGF